MLDVPELRAIPGLPGYFVSRDGRVFSNVKRIGRPNGMWEMTPQPYRGYFKFIALGKAHWVHRCVALAWIGRGLKGQVVCHNDNDVSNSNDSNLRWDTQAGNMQDKKANGTYYCGETHHLAKLTQAQVDEIRRAYAMKTGHQWGCREFARRFGVSSSTICRVSSEKSWKGV
ncbi:HNH endonuclease [Paraburkholderia silviterrae]|uniref:Uncharacterized protein n=1 Tax=Paraburkholderia silviterrae TaxID=2528715 RepID=A0A4R5MF57_9BURK|nr:HNH endonuclease [Paraburkholderia silviterrae]TDG25889.1 hypothetical protein EYW47_00520 [Paraburkholderia silviterrae]